MTAPAVTTTDARRMSRASLALAAGEIVGKLATLALFSLMARALGVGEFGVFSFGLGAGLLLSSAVTLGFDQRLVQLAGGDPHSLSQRLSTLLALRGLLTLVVVGVTAAALPFLTDEPGRRTIVLVMVLAGCCDTITEAFRSAASTRHVQTGPAVVLVIQRVLALVLVAAALVAGWRAPGAAVAYCAASLVGLVLMGLVASRRAGATPAPSLVRRAHARDFLISVRVTGLNDLVSMALFRIDVVILAMLAGDVAVGHYTAAYRLIETVLFVSWSVCRVILPAMADGATSPAHRSRIAAGALSVIVAVYLPYAALLAVRGDDLVELLFGEAYVDSGILVALALAPLFFGVAQVAINSLLALSPDPIVLRASAVALGLNLALNMLLIPRFGAAAAAATTTLAYLAQALVAMRGLRRELRPDGVRRSLLVAGAATLLSAVVLVLPLPALVAVGLGGMTYAAAWWLASSRFDPVSSGFVRNAMGRTA